MSLTGLAYPTTGKIDVIWLTIDSNPELLEGAISVVSSHQPMDDFAFLSSNAAIHLALWVERQVNNESIPEDVREELREYITEMETAMRGNLLLYWMATVARYRDKVAKGHRHQSA